MKPSLLLQIFRRTNGWLTPRGWAMVGGFVAATVLVFTYVIQWR